MELAVYSRQNSTQSEWYRTLRDVQILERGDPVRDWLKNLRLEKGWTQLQTAEKMGVSESYYFYIETGERQKKMDIVVVSKLAEIFGRSIPEIIEMESSRTA